MVVSRPWSSGNEHPSARRPDGRARRASQRGHVARGTMRRRDLPTAFHATAPMRLDFAGGWTDVPPFSAREGGIVVNGSIELRAHDDPTFARREGWHVGPASRKVESHGGGRMERGGQIAASHGTTCHVATLGSSPRTSVWTPRTRVFIP